MKKYLRFSNFVFLAVLMISCGQVQENEEKVNPIEGNWAFLDMRGNYNEAYFGDSLYYTFNHSFGHAPEFKYELRGDSLYSNIDKRKTGLNFIANLTWLDQDTVIFKTEFTKDTLNRIFDAVVRLDNTNLESDSIQFMDAFNQRYEDFLIAKGILSTEEVKRFKEKQIVPDDIKQN